MKASVCHNNRILFTEYENVFEIVSRWQPDMNQVTSIVISFVDIDHIVRMCNLEQAHNTSSQSRKLKKKMSIDNLKEALRRNNDYRCHLESRINQIYSLLSANLEKQVTYSAYIDIVFQLMYSLICSTYSF